jgi:rubrerythrin
MTTTEKFSHIEFSLFVSFLFGGTLLLVALFFGCQKKVDEQERKPLVTIENLQTAYEKSIMRHNLYMRFAQRAEAERYASVAKLFRAAARSKEIHATLHANLLRKMGVEPRMPREDSVAIGRTLQTLKMAISCAQLETDAMYPNLIRTAELENFPEAVDQFKKVREANVRHLDLFKDASDRRGKIQKKPYHLCPMYGYIMPSEKTEECPLCGTGKEKFEVL